MYSNKWNVLAITIAVVCLVGGTYGQDPPTPPAPAPEQPLNCSAANALLVDALVDFAGTWYEVGRNPANPNVGCVEIKSKLSADNTTLNLNITYSNTPTTWWQNRTESGSLTLTNNNVEGNVTFTLNNQTQTPVFFKLLQTYNNTDGVKFIAGCGQTNSSDNSTVFAYLLSNTLLVNQTGLNYINKLAAQNFSDFSNSSNIAAVNQQGCIRNSSSTAVPVLTGFFAAFFLLLKALHLA